MIRFDQSRSLARFAWFTLAFNIFVILWGAYVRATGSGAGCGNRWPLCNGVVLPRTAQVQTIIEFTHRLTSGLAVAMVCWLIVWCWRRTSKRDWPRYSSILAGIFLLNEALLGALLVLLGHVSQDRSTAHAVYLSLHFGNTMLLLATLALTAHWLATGEGRFRIASEPREALKIGIGLLLTMCLGLTGSLAALGDTLFPATSLNAALIQDLSSNNVLLRLRPFHPVAAAMGAAYVLWIVLKISRRPARSSARVLLLVVVLIVQIGLGILNVILLAPVWLQILHLLVAELFWILVVLTSADQLVDSEEAARLPTSAAFAR